jgi:IS30 family transposase
MPREEKLTPIVRDQIKRDFEAGVSDVEIVQKTGLSPSTISRLRRGIYPRPSGGHRPRRRPK